MGVQGGQTPKRFWLPRHARFILSLPGADVILGVELLCFTGGDSAASDSADRLTGSTEPRRLPVPWGIRGDSVLYQRIALNAAASGQRH